MGEREFVGLQKEKWQNLEMKIKLYKRKNARNTALAFEILDLYNDACGSLSYFRTRYPASAACEYLNKLVADAHGVIYAKKTSKIKQALNFFIFEVPETFRKNIIFFIVSTSFFLLGFLASFIATFIDQDSARLFLDPAFIASVEEGVGVGGVSISGGLSFLFSGVIMTNNINVGLNAFALGITGGIGSLYVLWVNSAMLGALSALAMSTGQGVAYWSLIIPHGFLELFAIFVCGAAGLIIGFGLLIPGKYSIKDSLILSVKKALKLVIGMIPVFILAGLIEGFITPADIPAVVKIVFAFITPIPLVFYLRIKDKSQKLKESEDKRD